MIHFALPYDPAFPWTAGWGELLAGMRQHAEVNFDPAWAQRDYPVDFDEPMLTMVRSTDMLPIYPHLRSGGRNVAIAVPIEQYQLKRYITNAHRNWDHVIANSTWSAEMIVDAGFHNVTTIIHGAGAAFTPQPVEPHDGFVIFSAGKLELRKAQDIVIQAVGIMMQRHRDVHLICDWYNPWPSTIESIKSTALWQKYPGLHSTAIMRRCGIDFARVRMLQTEHSTVEEHLAEKLQAMRSCDVGLFPNRAEGVGNSMMLETMACSRAVIAMYAHGQADVLDPGDPLVCHRYERLLVTDRNGDRQSLWFEPDLDEIVDKLEFAYGRRGLLQCCGERNAARIEPMRCAKIARKYVDACEGRGTQGANDAAA